MTTDAPALLRIAKDLQTHAQAYQTSARHYAPGDSNRTALMTMAHELYTMSIEIEVIVSQTYGIRQEPQ